MRMSRRNAPQIRDVCFGSAVCSLPFHKLPAWLFFGFRRHHNTEILYMLHTHHITDVPLFLFAADLTVDRSSRVKLSSAGLEVGMEWIMARL